MIQRSARICLHGFHIQTFQIFAKHTADRVGTADLTVQLDILRDGKAREQHELLVYHADTGFQGVKGRVELHLRPVDQDVPLIAAGLADHVHAKQYFHKGALAGAVLAHQAQHLARFQGEVDVREHLIAEKALFDIPHFKQRSVVLFHNHPYLQQRGGRIPSLPA